MTRVQFYHNTENPLALACELIGNAFAGGRRVALRVADEDTARRVDQMLWSFDQFAFIPHVAAGSPLAAETPVVISHARANPHWPHHDMLFNLAGDIAPDCDEFRMVVEIIGREERDRLPARARWMQYKASGHSLQAFDSERREAM